MTLKVNTDKPLRYENINGYKYRNCEDRTRQIEIYGNLVIANYFVLAINGLLTIRKDYIWNGSNWSLDWKSKEASMFHDCGYQMMCEGLIGQEHRAYIDELYRDILLEKGLWKWHANLRYNVLRKFGRTSAKLQKKPTRIILEE